jgi:hypothetical protein
MVIGNGMILTQGYKLQLNAFHFFFGVSSSYRVSYSSGILEFGSN